MILVRHESAGTILKINYDLSYTLLQDHSWILIFHTNKKNQIKNLTDVLKILYKTLLLCYNFYIAITP